MISTTLLAGELGEVFALKTGELYRYVHLDAIAELYAERPMGSVFKVPVHAFGNIKTSFYALPKGTRVIIRGWIETRDEIGVFVSFSLSQKRRRSLPLKARGHRKYAPFPSQL